MHADTITKIKEQAPIVISTAAGVGVSIIKWDSVWTSLVTAVLTFLVLFILRKIMEGYFLPACKWVWGCIKKWFHKKNNGHGC